MSSAVGTKAEHDGQFRDWSFSSTAHLCGFVFLFVFDFN